MSVFSEAVAAVQAALKLSDDLRRTSQELKDLALEVREHDRRITRLEAQWETAIVLSKKRLPE
jgi:cell shape-determining protein MreC